MYTRILRKLLRTIDSMRAGHCSGDGGGGGTGHCY